MSFDKKQEYQLMSTLYNYIQDTKDTKLEIKPKEYNETKEDQYSTYENIVKYKNNVKLNENKIICGNIITKFFELNDEKFLLCLNKILAWGFETFFKEFILNYYLYIKKSNRLRQYIILNLSSIITILKNELELDLLENMKNFNFNSYKTSQDVAFLKNDLRNRETAMMAIKAKNFNEFSPPSEERKELLTNGQRKTLRAEILNRLKYENPKLEEDF